LEVIMKYEFMVVLKPFLPEDVRVKLQSDIKNIFEKNGAKFEKEDLWGKRHLAYSIKGHEEGYYILYDLTLPKGGVDKINTDLRLISDILRYILIKKGK